MAQARGALAARLLRPPTRSRSTARPAATADRRCPPAPAGPVSSVRLGTAGLSTRGRHRGQMEAGAHVATRHRSARGGSGPVAWGRYRQRWRASRYPAARPPANEGAVLVVQPQCGARHERERRGLLWVVAFVGDRDDAAAESKREEGFGGAL